jgi:CheY-like chemotaxis protein
MIDAAIKMAVGRISNPDSFRELFEQVIRLRQLTWEEVESTIQTQVIQVLELSLPYAGQFSFNPETQIDLSFGQDSHGLIWPELMAELARRQQEWQDLAALVPSIESIPRPVAKELDKIADPSAWSHLTGLLDGQRSLPQIAELLDRDPLELVYSWQSWIQLGGITFTTEQTSGTSISVGKVSFQTVQKTVQSTILAVDDSPIVQISIRRALGELYEVLLASSAMEALKLLTLGKVDLMISDVTMPEIDGLELCKTVRNIPKFKDLPIIMLTARDNYSDKLKGRFVGSTEYLVKPFDPEQLLEIVGKYVKA